MFTGPHSVFSSWVPLGLAICLFYLALRRIDAAWEKALKNYEETMLETERGGRPTA
jgi:hypothetical protein